MMLGKLDNHLPKNEIGPLTPLTKINSKWNEDLTIKTITVKQLEGNIGEKFLDWSQQRFFGCDTRSANNTSKNKLVGLYQAKKLPHSKRNNEQNEKASYGMGEIFANHISDKRLISKNIWGTHTPP